MISLVGRIVSLGGALVLGAALWDWFGQPPERTFGTTTGTIIVSSPEVYSRERLVNDRFQEATWLESELRGIDNLRWGTEASISSSHSGRSKTEIQVGADQPAPNGKSPDDQGNQPAQTADTSDQTSRLDASRQGSTDGAAQSSPIDRFRDRVAYREEVRAAALETQLDDRHDIAGNTLYRVKFSITIVPEHDTSAWALVYVELKGADDSSAGSNASGEAYRQWVEYYEEQLNYELDRLSDRSTTEWQPEEFRKFSGYVTAALRAHVCPDGDPVCTSRLAARTSATQAKLEARERDFILRQQPCNPPSCDRTEQQERCDSSFKPPGSCPWHFDNFGRLEALLQDYRAALYPYGSGQSNLRPRQFFREVIADYLLEGLKGHNSHNLWTADVVDREVGMSRIKLEPLKADAAERFAAALSADQVFAYAVSPKESVQRIANLASSQRERQMALRTSVANQQVPLNVVSALLQRSEKDDSLMQAVLRKPLVVGFAPPGASTVRSRYEVSRSSGTADPPATDNVANFGWIIGPRFDIGDGNTPRFRHAPSENDVSAIISVPSWWKSVAVNVTTCWVDERRVRQMSPDGSGVDLYAECKDRHGEQAHAIQLPGNPTEVARKLGLDIVRRPSVFNQVNMVVEAGKPADILIAGNHLWRSTVVTLNGTPANNITVLPDMKGIVARFNEIARPLTDFESRRLEVFTSEGSTLAGSVVVTTHQTPATEGATGAVAMLTKTVTKERKQ